MDIEDYKQKLTGYILELDLTKYWLKFEKFMRKLIERVKR